MTLASTDPREVKNGNDSTTVFSFTFVVNASTDLVVTHTDSSGTQTVLTEGTGTTNYSVSVSSYPGSGSITYPATLGTELATGETLTLQRVVDVDQDTDLKNQAAWKPEQVENALDYSCMIDLQQQDEIDRSIKFVVSADVGTFNTDVPEPVASKAIAINSAGTGFELVDEPSAAASAAAASAAAASTSEGNAATSESNASTSASNASTSASNASTSASNAATSESNAANSAAAAAASAAGIFWKEPVLNATTANITLSGEQTIDGVLTSTSRILVKDQTASEENGVYVTAAGAWARATPLDTWDEHVGAAVIASEGTANADTAWICTVDAGGTLETTAITWAQMSAVYTTATDAAEGIIELATQAEVDAGTDTSRAITPATLAGASGVIDPAHVAGAVNAQTGTTYTLVLGDAYKSVTMDNASANTLTIPTNASVAFPTGARLDIWMKGAGVTTITGDTGVTVNGVSAGSGDLAQYGACSIVKIGTDTWLASGITAA